jgi:rhomboid family GlyGly-CTERM serine protease
LRLPWPGWAATGLAALLIGLAAGGAGVREALRWERTGLAAGEAWRLLTGHLVHLDLTHALLNAAGLLLVAALWRGVFRPLQWGVIVVAAVVTIDSGLWFLDSGLDWYVGASGVLHAAMAAGIAREAAGGDRLALALAAAGLAKLAAESWGLGPGSGVIESSLVVTSAHRYGAATGALLGLFYFWSSRASINRTVR